MSFDKCKDRFRKKGLKRLVLGKSRCCGRVRSFVVAIEKREKIVVRFKVLVRKPVPSAAP